MTARLPGVANDTQVKVNRPVVDKTLRAGFEPAIRILRQKVVDQQQHYCGSF